MNNRIFGINEVFQNTDSMIYANKLNRSNPMQNNFLQAESGDFIQTESGDDIEINI